MSNLGANFRKAREAAGLPLEKIAADTRISTRFLNAIENEDFHLLPGGIFNRGFIKSYAEYLGLDSTQVLADYERISAPEQEPVEVLRNADSAAGPDRNLYPIAAAILLALMAAYYLVTRKTSSIEPQSPPAATMPAVAENTADNAAPTATQSETNAPVETAVPQPIAPEPVAAVSAAVNALAVDLNVRESTWIRVMSDGKVVLSEVLGPGELRRFSADRSMDVTIGNAAGATLQINGRDLGQLGTPGQVREFRITPENAADIKA